MRLSIRILSILLLILCAARAADSKPVAVDPDGDPQFRTQGEYLGAAKVGDTVQSVGLQIVAGGDGRYEGMAYAGGLPGWGWDGKQRWKLAGAVYQQEAFLSGEIGQVRIAAAADTARLLTAEGQPLGELPRVRRESPTLGLAAPSYARVLFDGRGTDAWKSGVVTSEGWLLAGPVTKDPVRDFTLHLEFRTPYMPHARGQARGNSGVYIQERYEVQILDSFGLEGVNNECGGLYKTRAPDLNMCLPPRTWQTYEIDFQAARFNDQGVKTLPARISVRHNNVYIHRDVEIPDKTGGGAKEEPTLRPIKLQDHGNPVVFRNVWLVDHHAAATAPGCPERCAPPCELFVSPPCEVWFPPHRRGRAGRGRHW